MLFYSTNRKADEIDLRGALLAGQAGDRGLFLPKEMPVLHPQELAQMALEDYPTIAWRLLRKFTQGTFEEDVLRNMCLRAYDFPVLLEKVSPGQFVMRLDQGPTASFKDFAGRMMGQMFGRLHPSQGKPLVILTATSGDTGSAVAHAFYRIPGIQVVVLFPPAEVSIRQRKQMTTLQENISAIGIQGKFDDCQALAKKAFADPALQSIALTSANSINIGRLLPQMVYYVYAYAKIAGGGEPILFSIPSGNFGNMMGAVMAKRMGLPIHRILVATNANDEFPRFLHTGRYEKLEPSRNCLSNAMNVGHPSNLARLVDLYGGHLDEAGVLHRQPDLAAMRKDLWAVSISDDETRDAICQAWREHRLLLEPHGAVAWAALQSYRKEGSAEEKMVSVETAHPAKFPEEIRRLLGFCPQAPACLSSLDDRKEDYISLPADYTALRDLLRQKFE